MSEYTTFGSSSSLVNKTTTTATTTALIFWCQHWDTEGYDNKGYNYLVES
jgi:hypothetical protein